jgi:hypothetical protein
LFKQDRGNPGNISPGIRTAEKAGGIEPGLEETILCRFCRHGITHPDEAIAAAGAHRHIFANPAGIVFQIGCFRRAPGCSYIGTPTEAFTWFSGFAWRIALCLNCRINLGWQFSRPAGEQFHGLILDRVVFPGT